MRAARAGRTIQVRVYWHDVELIEQWARKNSARWLYGPTMALAVHDLIRRGNVCPECLDEIPAGVSRCPCKATETM